MGSRVARVMSIVVSAIVVCCAVYAQVRGGELWYVPVYALGTAVFFHSGWQSLAQRKLVSAVASIMFALLCLACAVDTLTGTSWPIPAIGLPVGIAGFVYLVHVSKRGWGST